MSITFSSTSIDTFIVRIQFEHPESTVRYTLDCTLDNQSAGWAYCPDQDEGSESGKHTVNFKESTTTIPYFRFTNTDTITQINAFSDFAEKLRAGNTCLLYTMCYNAHMQYLTISAGEAGDSIRYKISLSGTKLEQFADELDLLTSKIKLAAAEAFPEPTTCV